MHGGSGFAAPPWLLFPLMMVAAALAGALLLLGPALLKTRLGVDEVVTTLLLNFIVAAVRVDDARRPDEGPDARWAGRRPWRSSRSSSSRKLIAALARAHRTAAIALVLAVGLWALLHAHRARLRDARRRRQRARRRLRRHAGDAHAWC